MPLVFDNPEQLSLDAAKVQAIHIVLSPSLQVSIQYVSGPEDGAEIVAAKSGAESFDQAQYAAVDADGSVYAQVKDLAYKLLETRLGAGQIV